MTSKQPRIPFQWLRKLRSRKLLVAFLFALLFLGWFQHIAREQLTVVRLRQFNAKATYRCGNVVGISFPHKGSSFSDAQLPLLTGLRLLEDLDFSRTEVTTIGLSHVKELPRLQRITVMVDQITAQQETELARPPFQLTIQKLHNIDGRMVVDGYQ